MVENGNFTDEQQINIRDDSTLLNRRQYKSVSTKQRKLLKRYVNVLGMSIKVAAANLNIIYSTAKYIIRNQTENDFQQSFKYIDTGTAKGKAPMLFKVVLGVKRRNFVQESEK